MNGKSDDECRFPFADKPAGVSKVIETIELDKFLDVKVVAEIIKLEPHKEANNALRAVHDMDRPTSTER